MKAMYAEAATRRFWWVNLLENGHLEDRGDGGGDCGKMNLKEVRCLD